MEEEEEDQSTRTMRGFKLPLRSR